MQEWWQASRFDLSGVTGLLFARVGTQRGIWEVKIWKFRCEVLSVFEYLSKPLRKMGSNQLPVILPLKKHRLDEF